MKTNKKGIAVEILAVVGGIVLLVAGVQAVQSFGFFGIKTAQDISQYYEIIRLDNIADETKQIFGESSLDYALMQTSYDLAKHGGINPDSKYGFRVSNDKIVYWKTLEGKAFDYSEKEKERDVNNELLTSYLTKFYDNYENKLKFIFVDIGKPKARFLEPLDKKGFARGEYTTEGGISVSSNNKISRIKSEGFVESEVKVRYWKLYEKAGNFVDSGSLEKNILDRLKRFDDHYSSSGSCGSGSCPGDQTNVPSKEEVASAIKDELNKLKAELNQKTASEKITWELTLINNEFQDVQISDSSNYCRSVCCPCC